MPRVGCRSSCGAAAPLICNVSAPAVPHAAAGLRQQLALAVLDLPFEAGEHEESVDGREFILKAAGPTVIYHQEILEECENSTENQESHTRHYE